MTSGFNQANKIAQFLLEIEAVKLNPQSPFTWSSGLKSPIYCDNRLLLSYPGIRDYIKEAFVTMINNNAPDGQVIAGVATAGIPHATMIADQLGMPLAYVRASTKKHGTENKIEGTIAADQQVVVIEDLISTGGSSLNAIQTIRDTGAQVDRLFAIFSYGFEKAHQTFEAANVKLTTLLDYETLINEALAHNYISDQGLASLQSWRKDPEQWSEAKA